MKKFILEATHWGRYIKTQHLEKDNIKALTETFAIDAKLITSKMNFCTHLSIFFVEVFIIENLKY